MMGVARQVTGKMEVKEEDDMKEVVDVTERMESPQLGPRMVKG